MQRTHPAATALRGIPRFGANPDVIHLKVRADIERTREEESTREKKQRAAMEESF